MEHTGRHYGYDNIKGILIICVVFGHFLELCTGSSWASRIYLVIYSFHMPAFLFLSGFFAKYKRSKICRLISLYVLFQTLYCLFARYVLHATNAPSLPTALTTPYWLLWYLPVLLYCHLLLPLWLRRSHWQKCCLLLFSICISLLCGYWNRIGYPFSLSRFWVFLPFFLAGQLVADHQDQISRYWLRSAVGSRRIILHFAIYAFILSLYLLQSGQFTAPMLYGSHPYAIGYHPGIRLQVMGIAAVWIGLFMILANTIFNRRIPVLTHIGAHTLPIYLLHGFLIKFIAQYYIPVTVPPALICTLVSIAISANPLSLQMFHFLEYGHLASTGSKK